MLTKTYKAYVKGVDVAARTVEQIVSVFNNVDLGGDRVNEGAFVNSLAEWEATEAVLSAYFSHQWEDPFANLGPVIEARELAPGDEILPDDVVVTEDGKTLRDLGGLYVKYQFDPEGKNAFADQVFWLLSEKRITQASFAYDIVRQKRNSDGVNDLLELKLLEVGPTLLGMNPVTTTLLAKKSMKELAEESGATEEQVKTILSTLQKQVSHPFIAGDDDPSRCAFPDCGLTITAMAHIQRLSTEPDNVKSITFDGSMEQRQEAFYQLAQQWARDGDVGNGGFFACYLEATFDDRIVFMVEGWSDPWGEGVYYEALVASAEDGTFSMEEPTEVRVTITLAEKANRRDFSSAAAKLAKGTVSKDDETKSGTNAEATGNAEGATTEASESVTNTDEVERAKLDAELMLLDS